MTRGQVIALPARGGRFSGHVPTPKAFLHPHERQSSLRQCRGRRNENGTRTKVRVPLFHQPAPQDAQKAVRREADLFRMF